MWEHDCESVKGEENPTHCSILQEAISQGEPGELSLVVTTRENWWEGVCGGGGNKPCSCLAQNHGYDLSHPNIYSIYELLEHLKGPNLQTHRISTT